MNQTRCAEMVGKVGSAYGAVIVSAKRARQINNYYHHLGEGSFEVFPPPMVEIGTKNYLSIAMEEIVQDKLKFHYPEE